MQIALQGCLRATNVDYGITADTGGHIRYVLELANSLVNNDRVADVTIVTRRFLAHFAPYADTPFEKVKEGLKIVRITSQRREYVPMVEIPEELPSLEQSLVNYLHSLPTLPDVLHAHYAEAAELALKVREIFDIPFIYTPHSYARVRASLSKKMPDTRLATRIAREDMALATADLVTASSVHEAEQQASLSPSYRPEKILVLPPGINVEAFSTARVTEDLRQKIEAPLVNKQKSVVLAIARPVWKKNLSGLVRAFAASSQLRESANLLIVAGRRERIADLEPEAQEVIRDLLELVHDNGLEGSVSIPRQHISEEITGFYRYAYERHGIFVSPAFSEPFGLTLLEAAAAGIPSIGSSEGAPVEIVRNLGHGIVVSPNNVAELTDAMEVMLADLKNWDALSRQGRRKVCAMTWEAHTIRYLEAITALNIGRRSRMIVCKKSRLIVCDIDGTLVGDIVASEQFTSWLNARNDLIFAVATGRQLHDALECLRVNSLPRPEIVVASVGAEIYWFDSDRLTFQSDYLWAERLTQSWDKERIRKKLANVRQLIQQPESEQRPNKLGYLTESLQTVNQARDVLEEIGHELVWSHGRYVDILPPMVSKASAVKQVCMRLGLTDSDVIVAGDSGNDLELLAAYSHSILVANWTDNLANNQKIAHAYVSSESFAGGVIEGLDYFLGRNRRDA